MTTPPKPTSEPRGNTAGTAWGSAVLFLAILGLFVVFRFGTSDVILPEDRLQTLNLGWADESRCVDCHDQAETFWETGHANTLQRVDDVESKELLEQLNVFLSGQSNATKIENHDGQFIAFHERDGVESQVRLDWCLGSGTHARTWVGTLMDSRGATDLLEFRWSWYHEIDSFDITPGQPPEVNSGYFGGLGVLFDAPKTRKCLGCHASYLPIKNGHIDQHHIKPGVTCQRCHGPRKAHVDSEGDVRENSWKNIDQMDSVNRCAECHRRAEEQKPTEITPQNPDITRFQPVGLVQSPCFKNSRMTCLTCHDPHLAPEAQDSLGIWQCLQCHDETKELHSNCSAGHQDQCLSCHMPKVKMGESPVAFRDHWIRIRRQSEQQP